MNKKISSLQLALLSTGGMIGSGWLFSPFYGYQTAGIGVIYSWIITAVITLIIGLSFAEICSTLPIIGGIYRLIGITHNKNIAGIFLILGWLSYVVYLPLEAQSVIQYLGFWFPSLIIKVANQVELSWYGIGVAAAIILLITWFNTLLITTIAKANSFVSLWKIAIPLIIALIAIICFGNWHYFISPHNFKNYTAENVVLAVTSSGLAFAFSGFQNGLILANQVKNPKKSIPYSLFTPVIVGLILYILLSISYLACLNGGDHEVINAAAPLLGLVAMMGLNWLLTILFIDAVLAPLGTTNVYVLVTSRILYSIGKKLYPKTKLTKINKNRAPSVALWLNALVAIVFLFPFPTWKELVNFLSSVVVFAYLAGPISVLVLHHKQPLLPRAFKLPYPNIIAVTGFICCGWLIYWSGLANLGYLFITLCIVTVERSIFRTKGSSLILSILNIWYLFAYLGSLWFISYLHSKHIIAFPLDNLIVSGVSLVFCYIFVRNSLPVEELEQNISMTKTEIVIDRL